MTTSNEALQLRFLKSEDIPTIRVLCSEWFPIRYPDAWYQDLAESNKFYTLVATLSNEVVGLLVAEMRPAAYANIEDAGILCPTIVDSSRIVYILTLGVVSHCRRRGIATTLVQKLIENVQSNPVLEDCRAIYLHVLTTNTSALRFYTKLDFSCNKLIPDYYLINNSTCDGYLYVLYLNGGRRPKSVFGYICDLGNVCRRALDYWILSPILGIFYRKFFSPTKHKGNVYTL